MNYFSCTCSECEFCFPYNDLNFVCAGGAREGEKEKLFYKKYGDTIKREELLEVHYCEGFHQGLGYYFRKNFRLHNC